MQQIINGVEMYWREAGAGDALICIHGYPFNCTMWEPQLAKVPEGWWYVAPDLRGFGQTPARGSGPLTMDMHADDIIALMDHLRIERGVMCGLSMGGYVAFSLAVRYPKRVRALVLAATRAKADGPETQKNRHLLADRARKEGAQPVVASMLPKLLSAHTRMKHPQLVDTVRAMIESTSRDGLARGLEGMAARKDYTRELDSINVSTMVIRGEQDEIIPAGDMEVIARTVRGARQEVIPLVAHLPNLEESDLFNMALVQFLKFLPPTIDLGNVSLSF